MPHLHFATTYGNYLPALLLLITGMGLLVYAVICIYTGEAQIRSSKCNRADNPVQFWASVVILLGFGVFAICTAFD